LFATGLEGGFLGGVRVSRNGLIPSLWRLERLHFVKYPRVVRGDHLFNRVVELECTSEIEEVLFSPIAGEVPCNLVDRLVAATISLHCQCDGIPLSSHHRADDRHPSGSGEV